MERRILLVRHCAVDPKYQGVCYGQSDVGLSTDGLAHSLRIAEQLSALPVTHLFHSGLARTAHTADLVAARVGCPAVAETALRERDFGSWELRTWDAIFAEVGCAMDGLVRDPANYAPPNGETTFALRDRVLGWYRRLPPRGLIVAITHGGPIAVLCGALLDRTVEQWPQLIPACGSITETNEARLESHTYGERPG
jgi:broad specificity phosphatase PhoE